jgi:hypothetical protein
MMKSHEKAPPIIVSSTRLRVGVDLLRQPEPGEGERRRPLIATKLPMYPHPVVVRRVLVVSAPAGT